MGLPLKAVCPEEAWECGQRCTKTYRPVCASTGSTNLTFTNSCEMREAACTTRQVLVRVAEGPCEAVERSGSTPLGGKGEVGEAVEEGVRQLAGRRGEGVHYTLVHLESSREEVTSGTNYLLTVLVGASNCSTEQEYIEEECPVVVEQDR